MPQCSFCHKNVSGPVLVLHYLWHGSRRSDGQMRSHATLPPEQRANRSIEGEPTEYRHVGIAGKPGCGGVTGMPEDVQRTYLVQPRQYHSMFCAGCQKYRKLHEFEWHDTGENMQAYMDRIAQEIDSA
jgi:hypothetical protein